MATNAETEFVKTKRFVAKGGNKIVFNVLVNGEVVFLADKIISFEEDYPYSFLDSIPQELTVPIHEDWEFEIRLVRHIKYKKWAMK